jgi:hypothetical protein
MRQKGLLYSFFLIASQLFAHCDNNETPPATLDDLSVRYLEGYIEANLMPVVPPDPIVCRITVLAQNSNPTETLSGLSLPQADVFLDSSNQRLGTITFGSSWDGQLGPNDQDRKSVV